MLKDWMAREERGTVWVANKVGCTKAYISHILHGRLPLTDKLASDLQTKLGIVLPGNGRNGCQVSRKQRSAKIKKPRKI